MKILTKNEYLWLGAHGLYYTDFNEAQRSIDKYKVMTNPSQLSCWIDEAGHYYEWFTPKRIYINLPSREEALAKLTEADRVVLGVDKAKT